MVLSQHPVEIYKPFTAAKDYCVDQVLEHLKSLWLQFELEVGTRSGRWAIFSPHSTSMSPR